MCFYLYILTIAPDTQTFVSLRFASLRFVSFHLVSFRFVSSHFLFAFIILSLFRWLERLVTLPVTT